MSIWDRLGKLIKSYTNDKANGGPSGPDLADQDLRAAYEELDDLLKNSSSGEASGRASGSASGRASAQGEVEKAVPGELLKDFAELGLEPDASAEECKEAYKNLLKKHHPDHHTKHEGNLNKATNRTARINGAYERLMEWFSENPSE